MKAEYKRDMNHNYLVLHVEEEIDTDSYQVRILVGNVMPSLLKCRIQGMDGTFLIYYDITSRQSVASMYENRKLGLEDLRLVFGGFIQAMEEMAEYLMNPGQLLVKPEHMYLDIEKRKMYFCCVPGKENEVREQFRELTEYILPKIDHEDGAAVIVGYGVYRRALEDTFHLEHIKAELYKNGEVTERKKKEIVPPPEMPEEVWQEVTAEKEVPFGFREEKEDGRKSGEPKVPWKQFLLKTFLPAAAGALFLLVLTALSFLGFIPGVRMVYVLGGGTFLMGTGMVLCAFLAGKKKGKKLSDESKWKSDSHEEYSRMEKQESELCGETDLSWKKEEETKVRDFGETVVLSAHTIEGPATLVSREPGELATIYLQEELTVIGKMETAADAVIDLPTVSRIHARVRKREKEYYLSDLNSRNGTAVNGRLLREGEEYLLQQEDEVDFAQARYIFLK